MKILICGDYCPINRVSRKIENKDTAEILADIQRITNGGGVYAVVNLECPVIDPQLENIPIEKIGPNLCCQPAALNVLENAGFNCVTLANNHIYDYGQAGMESTIAALASSSLDYVGAGTTMADAQKPLYKDFDDKRVAFISACENEYSIADGRHGGANEIDPIALHYQIKEAKANADYVILILHGGKETYPLPTPKMKQTYRFFADCGADVVVNHHQHCFTGYEVYNGTPIFYGIGNFCFDEKDPQPASWYSGFMLELSITNDKIDFRIIPYEQCKKEPVVRLIEDDEHFRTQIEEMNAIIADDALLSREFERQIQSSYSAMVISPIRNRLLYRLAYHKLIPNLVSKRFRQSISHNIRCATHRESLQTWLKLNT